MGARMMTFTNREESPTVQPGIPWKEVCSQIDGIYVGGMAYYFSPVYIQTYMSGDWSYSIIPIPLYALPLFVCLSPSMYITGRPSACPVF